MTDLAIKHLRDELQSALDEINANLKMGLTIRYSTAVSVRDQVASALRRVAELRASAPRSDDPDTTGWPRISNDMVLDGDVPWLPHGSVEFPRLGVWAIPPDVWPRVEANMRRIQAERLARMAAQVRILSGASGLGAPNSLTMQGGNSASPQYGSAQAGGAVSSGIRVQGGGMGGGGSGPAGYSGSLSTMQTQDALQQAHATTQDHMRSAAQYAQAQQVSQAELNAAAQRAQGAQQNAAPWWASNVAGSGLND